MRSNPQPNAATQFRSSHVRFRHSRAFVPAYSSTHPQHPDLIRIHDTLRRLSSAEVCVSCYARGIAQTGDHTVSRCPHRVASDLDSVWTRWSQCYNYAFTSGSQCFGCGVSYSVRLPYDFVRLQLISLPDQISALWPQQEADSRWADWTPLRIRRHHPTLGVCDSTRRYSEGRVLLE